MNIRRFEDKRLKNDTYQDGWGGFLPSNQALSVTQLVEEPPLDFFDKLNGRPRTIHAGPPVFT